MKLNVPYERVVQWLAGPFAAAVGILATKGVTHLSWLGQAGLSKSSVAHAIVEGSVFVATAGVTLVAHAKWFTNLAKWWSESGLTEPASSDTPTVTPFDPPPPPQSSEDVLRQQLTDAGMTPVA